MPLPGSYVYHLLQEPLVQWDDAKSKHGVRLGEHQLGGDNGGGWTRPCWYADPEYNTTAAFVSACDSSTCSCDAIERLSLGCEQSTMCWHHHAPPPPPQAAAASIGRSVVPMLNLRRPAMPLLSATPDGDAPPSGGSAVVPSTTLATTHSSVQSAQARPRAPPPARPALPRTSQRWPRWAAPTPRPWWPSATPTKTT
jgi:hypothetical protein